MRVCPMDSRRRRPWRRGSRIIAGPCTTCCRVTCHRLPGHPPSTVGVPHRHSNASPSDGAETTVRCGGTDYVATAKKAGFWVMLSSTLSLRHIDNLEETLAAGVDLLTVSLSGIDQETYQINHVGGNLKYVMHNMAQVRDIIAHRALSTHVDL